MDSASSGNLPERGVISKVMHGVVQVVALKSSFLGNMSPAWTGSGTIVDPSGLVLTNCHVANPRAMGMPAPPADRLAIAVTERSDEPPVVTYFAEIVAQAPEIDLAVLRITGGVDGRSVSGLDLPYVELGDSDDLELGDTLAILGYPGIGGETVTFTSGSVAGFTREPRVQARRAWIKTDATIAGGNSGGTAVNHRGQLVGIPTQAAAGAGITPVDARPVVDTNRDGRVDQRDTPMAIGGFINGLRPVNLAQALLQQAGGRAPARQAPSQRRSTAPVGAVGPAFTTLVFSGQVTRDGRPINPAALLPAGGNQLFATFEYSGMQNGMEWGLTWALNDKTIVSEQDRWSDGPQGRRTLVLTNQQALPEGRYHLILHVGTQIMAEGEVVVGRQTDDTDTEISGVVVDALRRRGISEALVIALNPGVSVQDFVRQKDKSMAYTSVRTGTDGRFTFPKQLVKGQAYGLVVIAKGYRDLVVEGALRVTANAPEQAELSPIPLQPERRGLFG
jgi:S1-C subfamily serine protease